LAEANSYFLNSGLAASLVFIGLLGQLNSQPECVFVFENMVLNRAGIQKYEKGRSQGQNN
jgi:hypothetical protein